MGVGGFALKIETVIGVRFFFEASKNVAYGRNYLQICW